MFHEAILFFHYDLTEVVGQPASNISVDDFGTKGEELNIVAVVFHRQSRVAIFKNKDSNTFSSTMSKIALFEASDENYASTGNEQFTVNQKKVRKLTRAGSDIGIKFIIKDSRGKKANATQISQHLGDDVKKCENIEVNTLEKYKQRKWEDYLETQQQSQQK